MISIKDYAESKGVSYEAIRKSVVRYAAELEGHIRQDGRTQYLDEVAVAVLDSHRAKNPMVIYDQSRDERIRELAEENSLLTSELNLYKTKLIAAQEKIIDSKVAQALLEAADVKYRLLEESRDEYRKRAEDREKELDTSRNSEMAAIKALTDVERTVKDLEIELARVKKECDDAKAQVEAMKPRGLFAKIVGIFNKGE